ncbi:MAG: hypothetical protein ABIH23_18260 [bacterium]
MSTLYIGFTDEQLKKAPPLADDAEILCPRCLGTHQVTSIFSEDGKTSLQIYHCGNETYLTGMDGKLLMGVRSVL